MKKYIILIALYFIYVACSFSQEKISIYSAENVLFESEVSNVDSMKFRNTASFVYANSNVVEIPISEIDSIVFSYEPIIPNEDAIYITYNGSEITVVNPYEDRNVLIIQESGHVTVTATSGIPNIQYVLLGQSENGSFNISSDNNIIVTLSNLTLKNPTNTAINITSENIVTTINLDINSQNNISDSNESVGNAPILSKGALIFYGQGTLNLKGYKKHAISSAKTISVENGTITISQAASDGFHSEGFIMNGGNLDIKADGDGIDAGGETVVINAGVIKITSSANDVKGIKGDSGLTINGGTINMSISGAQSKGFGTKASAVFNGGNITLLTSGVTVLTSLGSGYDPSYCTAIKADEDITINNGTINIESANTSDGGKGLSADGNIIINNGTITITTAGDGKTYTNELGVVDSYTSCCIKADLNISLLGGSITCKSTGKGGKGISADGTLDIGILDAANENLILNVTTSGEQFLVSGSGENADYASPKAVKSLENLTVNSGIITISCTQSQGGGEGLESKTTLTINGGVLEISTYDDCINAANHIAINGGNSYFVSRGNDSVDSNGTLTVSGGFIIANGTRSPEEGFDCDNNQFKITGGVAIGTGGNTSNPTASVCTQPTVKYASAMPGQAICIKKTSGEIILMYQLPTYTGSGGGNQMTLLFTDPNFTNDSYTLQYGGTISGGTTTHGYTTGGTYSGGSSKNFTISSMLTTVN